MENLAAMFNGHHIDRTIPEMAEAVHYWMPSLKQMEYTLFFKPGNSVRQRLSRLLLLLHHAGVDVYFWCQFSLHLVLVLQGIQVKTYGV